MEHPVYALMYVMCSTYMAFYRFYAFVFSFISADSGLGGGVSIINQNEVKTGVETYKKTLGSGGSKTSTFYSLPELFPSSFLETLISNKFFIIIIHVLRTTSRFTELTWAILTCQETRTTKRKNEKSPQNTFLSWNANICGPPTWKQWSDISTNNSFHICGV